MTGFKFNGLWFLPLAMLIIGYLLFDKDSNVGFLLLVAGVFFSLVVIGSEYKRKK